MAQLVQKTSFTGGEIDQVVLERQNIQKVATGLEVARNMGFGKNALFERRKGTKYILNAKANTGNVKTFSVPYTDIVLEVTTNNIRIHRTDAGTYTDVVYNPIANGDIPNLKFVYSNKFLRAYLDGSATLTYFKTTSPCVYFFGLGSSGTNYVLSLDPTLTNPISGATLGYFFQGVVQHIQLNQDLHSGVATQTGPAATSEVEYAATVVTEDGEESVQQLTWLATGGAVQLKLPITASDFVEFTVQTDTTNVPYVTQPPLEYRFYRRPKGAGAFGYIGSCFAMTAIANGFQAVFRDLGQTADYSKSPPTYLVVPPQFGHKIGGKAGLIYQGRMLYGNNPLVNKEYIFASRPNFPWNLTRDYPLSDDSALLFKSGQTGVAEVLHMADMGTLVVFTSVGIYTQLQRGALTPTNAVLNFVSSSVASATVPPIKFGDLLLFYDGSVKAIDFSNQRQNYIVEDLTDFSGHLFKNKTLVSWATVKINNTDVLFAVMDDGTVVSLTKNIKQELEAWTPHDFLNGDAIAVCGDVANSKLLFVIERDGVRTLEYLGIEYMDSYVSKSLAVHTALSLSILALDWYFTAVTGDGFAGDIMLNTHDASTNFGTGFTVGKIYRMFDTNGDSYDIECTSIPSPVQVIFSNYNTNYEQIPVELRDHAIIYETFTEVTGLTHLNGKLVSATVDGATIASPLNTDLMLPDMTPVAGSVTVPRAAYATVGLPYISDVGTTDVKSPNDAKVALSSKLAGKVFIKADPDSKIMYAGSRFPDDDTLTDMKRSEEMFANQNNRNLRVRTFETVLVADWNNGGRVCIRVVDPIPFRLLSITTAVNIS